MSIFIHENRTPNGNPFRLECRTDTNDQNVSHAVSKLDEYGLAGLSFSPSAWAIDVGAYIGAVAIPLALDHSGLRVVAVEPVLENVATLTRNIAMNEVADRVFVCPLAATSPTGDFVTIRYGGQGRHRYVGNVGREAPDADEVTIAPPVALSDLLSVYEIDQVALLKIDCEGCEWDFLTDPAVRRVEMIVGEFHRGGFLDLKQMLDATHVVAVPKTATYNFVAVRRK